MDKSGGRSDAGTECDFQRSRSDYFRSTKNGQEQHRSAHRIGITTQPGSGKTSIRAGFGIAYDVKFQNFASITLPPQLQSELDPGTACTLTPLPGWCGNPNGAGFLANGGLPQTYVPPANQSRRARVDDQLYRRYRDAEDPHLVAGSAARSSIATRRSKCDTWERAALELPVQFRRNYESYFDAGGAALPTYMNASNIPQTWNANTPTDATYNNFACWTVPYACNPDPNFSNNTYLKYGFNGIVTSDPPYGSSTYNAASVNFTQHSVHGLTFNANYTFAHTIDNSTNEFFTSLLNPRRAQDTTQINQDRGNSDLDVRHKFAMSLTYQVPNVKSENRLVRGLGERFPGQLRFSFADGAAGDDSIGGGRKRKWRYGGDRVVFNPNGAGNSGSDVYAVCAATAGTASGTSVGHTYIGGQSESPAIRIRPTGARRTHSIHLGFDPAIGYTPVNPHAKYIVAGPGVRANLGRNTFYFARIQHTGTCRCRRRSISRKKVSAGESGCVQHPEPPQLCVEQRKRLQRGRHNHGNDNAGICVAFRSQLPAALGIFQRGIPLVDFGIEVRLLTACPARNEGGRSTSAHFSALTQSNDVRKRTCDAWRGVLSAPAGPRLPMNQVIWRP